MREIKFRGWSDSVKQMTYFGNGQGIITSSTLKDGEIWGVFFPSQGGSIYLTGYQDFMQYTGRKDKNGKDIYRGDILQAADPHDKLTFTVKWYDEGSFNLLGINTEAFVVLGNIYENPELLKVEVENEYK